MVSDKLLQLPFEIQAVLAIGYLAYRLATAGLDRHHRTGDFVLQVLVYGAIAKVAQEGVAPWIQSPWCGLGVGLVLALLAAACWRAFGRRATVWLLRKFRVTRENYSPSTWASLIDDPRPWHYVSVKLRDGTWLESNIDGLPKRLPHDPLDVDTDGNIAMYVTSRTDPNGTEHKFETADVLDEFGRAQITYIPASQIDRVTISFGAPRPRTVTSSSGEAA